MVASHVYPIFYFLFHNIVTFRRVSVLICLSVCLFDDGFVGFIIILLLWNYWFLYILFLTLYRNSPSNERTIWSKLSAAIKFYKAKMLLKWELRSFSSVCKDFNCSMCLSIFSSYSIYQLFNPSSVQIAKHPSCALNLKMFHNSALHFVYCAKPG